MELTGRNTLDTTTTCETANSRLGDTLDVVTQDLTVTLGATFSETLATFSAYREVSIVDREIKVLVGGQKEALM